MCGGGRKLQRWLNAPAKGREAALPSLSTDIPSKWKQTFSQLDQHQARNGLRLKDLQVRDPVCEREPTGAGVPGGNYRAKR